MNIKLMMPVYATAEFEADIDIEGKTVKQIFDEFYEECKNSSYLCHQCARTIETDFVIDDYGLTYIKSEIKSLLNRKQEP